MGSNARASRVADVDLHDQQQRFEASGKIAVPFCREQGIPVSTFYQRRAHRKTRAGKPNRDHAAQSPVH